MKKNLLKRELLVLLLAFIIFGCADINKILRETESEDIKGHIKFEIVQPGDKSVVSKKSLAYYHYILAEIYSRNNDIRNP